MTQQYDGAIGSLGYIKFHFHKWTKWNQYERQKEYWGTFANPRDNPIRYMERRQRRHCLICNYEQDKEVHES